MLGTPHKFEKHGASRIELSMLPRRWLKLWTTSAW
jgi:hypothetical protein